MSRPADIAANQGNVEMVKLLLANGAAVDKPSRLTKFTPLMAACVRSLPAPPRSAPPAPPASFVCHVPPLLHFLLFSFSRHSRLFCVFRLSFATSRSNSAHRPSLLLPLPHKHALVERTAK